VWLHWLVIILCAVVLFLNWPQASIAATKKTNFQTGVKAYLTGNYTAAFKLWQPLATAGDAPAHFNLGVLYAQGLGI